MSKASQWKKIFGHAEKEKVQVRVGDQFEQLTNTQAYRFKELTRKNARRPQDSYSNPFEQTRYSLGDAAFRLMTSEDEILQMAAAGSIDLFASVAGLTGCWRREADDGSKIDSPELTLGSGYLALTLEACREIAARGCASASRFEFPDLADPSATNLDAETLTVLSTWHEKKKSFLLREPLRVDRDALVLLAPLPTRMGSNRSI